MKKYIKNLLLLALAAVVFTGCKEEYGTDPGNDGTPVATVYQYTVGEGYNSDNDCHIRVATNAAVNGVYYLSELKSAKEARKMTEAQYNDYVVANGKKVEIKASDYKDIYVTDLHGFYAITVVAVNGNQKTSQSVEFTGLDYKKLGTFPYASEFFGDLGKVEVEYSEVGNRYRIKNLWTDGYGFSFSPHGSKVTVYPSSMPTGYKHPNYGMVSVADQGSTYDEASKTFTFNFKFSVSAGEFGLKVETLTLKN